ncbi:unnamed protein product [Polarella glacialis]|uniref:Uncharacterized protein n=1 Tax=Polarella glacialis TaxID=89957 RepID=A0A813H3S1_POLGL|nr:unnamed protein product [Polarella glacialis]
MARPSAASAAAAAVTAAAKHWSAGVRSAAAQIRSDAQLTNWRQVAKEFAPSRLWRDFRRSNPRTQDPQVNRGFGDGLLRFGLVAVTGYGLGATGLIYCYLRYQQVKKKEEWKQVVKAWN